MAESGDVHKRTASPPSSPRLRTDRSDPARAVRPLTRTELRDSTHLKGVDVAAGRRPVQTAGGCGKREGRRRSLTLRDHLRYRRRGATLRGRDCNFFDVAVEVVVLAEVRRLSV